MTTRAANGLQFSVLLPGHLNFFHDDRTAGHGGNHFGRLYVIFQNESSDGVHDRRGVDYHVVLDCLCRHRQNPQVEEPITTFFHHRLNHFDRARTDIERDEAVVMPEGSRKAEIEFF